MLAARVGTLKYAIREVAAKAREVEARGKKIINLNIGDPLKFDFQVPTSFVEGVRKHLGKGNYSASEGVGELRSAVAEWEGKKGVAVDAKNIYMSNGVSEAVFGLFGVLLNPGDEIIVPSPVYPIYEAYSRFFGATPVFYDGINPSVEAIQALIGPKTKAIVIINPNNPTGLIYDEGFLRGVTELGPLVIADEIYDLMNFGKCPVNMGKLTSENLVVLNGFSKTFLAPGYRVGYAYFMGADKVEGAFLKYCQSRLCANTPVQWGAIEAIKEGGSWIKPTNKKLEKRRNIAYKGLKKLGLEVEKPEGAFYVFPKLPVSDDKKFVLDLIEREGVVLVHGSGFARAGHFRMVFLPPEEILKEAIEKIGRFMNG
ncbi:MAG: aminotransferase class I/II-fold pyridoxal phosphate-dependent enzyme [Candidatus Altiarchaeota archaeon]|nr:aminotransferase class I/II-fold pyridoxal phosphate-dependent enzyme [Candidatus Altiarchaeota archaeon]